MWILEHWGIFHVKLLLFTWFFLYKNWSYNQSLEFLQKDDYTTIQILNRIIGHSNFIVQKCWHCIENNYFLNWNFDFKKKLICSLQIVGLFDNFFKPVKSWIQLEFLYTTLYRKKTLQQSNIKIKITAKTFENSFE